MLIHPEILERVIKPGRGDIPLELARQILTFDFPPDDHERYAQLSAKASAGQLSDTERGELEDYLNVNDFLTIIKAKAKLHCSLRIRLPDTAMETATEKSVRGRAGGLCEYCLLPEATSTLKHVVDHVIARQHGGRTTLGNLALCCGRCNLHKGPNIAGIDPVDGHLVRLFNPRTDDWSAHFRWSGAELVGTTAIGRTTVAVLAMNTPGRLAVRSTLMKAGTFASPAQRR